MNGMNKKRGTVLMTGGLLLLLAAFLLTCYNLWDDARAKRSSEEVLEELLSQKVQTAPVQNESDNTTEQVLPDYMLNPKMEMPTETINGQEYIGVLEIPALGIELPIISEWSYPKLRISPCRYKGSAYLDNLVIAAHNYNHHFGGLKNLQPGNKVIFTDMDNNIFRYEVQEVEILESTSVDEMVSGDWDLTLFTCTIGGRTRVTVRCRLVED